MFRAAQSKVTVIDTPVVTGAVHTRWPIDHEEASPTVACEVHVRPAESLTVRSPDGSDDPESSMIDAMTTSRLELFGVNDPVV